MKAVRNISRYLQWVLLLAAAVLLAAGLGSPRTPGDTDAAARRVQRRLERRISILYGHVERETQNLPEDMVVYHYDGDSLKNWRGQFSITVDDINYRTYFQRLSNPRRALESPLTQVTDSMSFLNFGNKWYLVRRIHHDDGLVIAGLEVMNSQDPRSFNGVNPRLGLGDRFTVRPLTFSGGSAVSIGGRPQFKILYESLVGKTTAEAWLVWLAFAFFIAGLCAFLSRRKTLRTFTVVATLGLAAHLAMYFWGRATQMEYPLFSPVLFAGGDILFSLGAVILLNLFIILVTSGLYAVREDVYSRIKGRPAVLAGLCAVLAAIAGIIFYTHTTLCSISDNSNISLEIFKFGGVSAWTVVVYLSFMGMLMSVPLLLQFVQPAFSLLLGFHTDIFSLRSRSLIALAAALYLVGLSSVLGYRREQIRVEVLANRLAVDRDISLELQLRRVENSIAGDAFIAPLSAFDGAALTIQNRIVEYYLQRIALNYDITVYLFNDLEHSPQKSAEFNKLISGADPIVDGSRFLYADNPSGRPCYRGVFLYMNEGAGLSRMVLEVEAKSWKSESGYASILGNTPPGKVNLPREYSYARYLDDDLLVCKGEFAYPTRLSGGLGSEGYVHFRCDVSDSETVVVSRPRLGIFSYIIAGLVIALLAMLLLLLPAVGRKVPGPTIFEKSYYKTRISWVLMASLILTLVAMATVSVLFVQKRNEANLRNIMSDRIGSIQSMVQYGVSAASTTSDLRSPEMMALLQEVGGGTRADISLYAPDGLVIMSTAPEIFDRMYLGCRMNWEAFENIREGNKRYYIHKESINGRSHYCMYAPLMNAEGEMMAILGSPYTGGETRDFERDAIMHVTAILAVFIILLILARLAAAAVVDRMFKPLSEMGRKMSSAGLDSLEQIEYDRPDEVQSLVKSYNRMVEELSESSLRLAQAERDKAWSGMARQVAHEIKNPLTPMKLQLQRIIRLKQKGDPSWQEKFDEASTVLLDHIDMLTETANEFSTFAKLYTEEPTRIVLDDLLQEEISMFDNKDNVAFDYFGLSDAVVSGPKPQLTRVFVNLLGNAVQAIGEQEGGKVLVSVRNSATDGFYDIVFEDNGPGVAPENVGKLFTPNFTTKNGGSGLGLAISRSVLQRCGASIGYSRSFALGGACFTVKYPK